MGLFGPPKCFRERTFSMPCSRLEAFEVIAAAQDLDGNQQFGKILGDPEGQPPLVETIYLASRDENGFILAAGNRARTLWRMRMALSGDNPTNGVFGAIEFNDQRWFGNVLNMVYSLDHAIRSVGGRTGTWPT